MNLYLVSLPGEGVQYDSYNNIVVAAKDERDARTMHPGNHDGSVSKYVLVGTKFYTEHELDGSINPKKGILSQDDQSDFCGNWIRDMSDLEVKLI